jgi:hypothetical protein
MFEGKILKGKYYGLPAIYKLDAILKCHLT